MRTIIIIQTLIIIAGAYYIYTLSLIPQPLPAAEPVVIEKVATSTATTALEAETEVITESEEVAPTGHSDVGMEFPTLDEEPQSR